MPPESIAIATIPVTKVAKPALITTTEIMQMKPFVILTILTLQEVAVWQKSSLRLVWTDGATETLTVLIDDSQVGYRDP